MAADDMATQGARASATMMFTMLNWINSVPASSGLTWFSFSPRVLFTSIIKCGWNYLSLPKLQRRKLFYNMLDMIYGTKVDVNSKWWLLMTWHQHGARASATFMLTNGARRPIGSPKGVMISIWYSGNKLLVINFFGAKVQTIPRELVNQYHGYWCPGSLRCQMIGSHVSENLSWMGHCFPRRTISTFGAI